MQLSKIVFFKRMSATASLIAILISISGCGKKDEPTTSPTSSNQPVASVIPVTTASVKVDGYKSFKFGMKPSAVAKLPECTKDYDGLIAQKEADEKNNLQDTIHSVENNILNDNDMSPEQKADKEQLIKLQSELNQKSNKEALLSQVLSCSIELSGEPTSIILNFNDQLQLQTISMSLGVFTQEKLVSLVKNLQEKYTLVSSPSDVDMANVNKVKSGKASYFFANNSVELQIFNYNNSKYISLSYHDAGSSLRAVKEAQKGNASKNDL